MFGFVAPFYAYRESKLPRPSGCEADMLVTAWALKSGFLAAYAAQGVLCAGLGVIICGGLIWKGYGIRQAQGMPVNDRRT